MCFCPGRSDKELKDSRRDFCPFSIGFSFCGFHLNAHNITKTVVNVSVSHYFSSRVELSSARVNGGSEIFRKCLGINFDLLKPGAQGPIGYSFLSALQSAVYCAFKS